jgi:hypothetical protein
MKRVHGNIIAFPSQDALAEPVVSVAGAEMRGNILAKSREERCECRSSIKCEWTVLFNEQCDLRRSRRPMGLAYDVAQGRHLSKRLTEWGTDGSSNIFMLASLFTNDRRGGHERKRAIGWLTSVAHLRGNDGVPLRIYYVTVVKVSTMDVETVAA